MTNEEAIAYGNRVINLGLNDETQSFCEVAIKALEELQAHREAWMKVVSAVDQHTDIHSDGEFYIKNFDVKKIIAEYV